MEGVGGRYRVALEEGGEVEATLRGRVKRQVRIGDRVVAGDRVLVLLPPGEEGGTIESVLPRERQLLRRGLHARKARVVAANVDRALVVVSPAEPEVRLDLVDRFLVLAEVSGVPPALVVNKVELPGVEPRVRGMEELYRRIGYPVLLTSVPDRRGMEPLRELLASGITAVMGPSGVGKSSLLNALEPGLQLRTAEVSGRDGRGRHTTVSARLLPLSGGGAVVDTPGFSDASLWEVEARELAEAFPEFRSLAHGCRFRGCTHTHEPGCRVLEGVEAGEVDPRRLESYRSLLQEVREG